MKILIKALCSDEERWWNGLAVVEIGSTDAEEILKWRSLFKTVRSSAPEAANLCFIDARCKFLEIWDEDKFLASFLTKDEQDNFNRQEFLVLQETEKLNRTFNAALANRIQVRDYESCFCTVLESSISWTVVVTDYAWNVSTFELNYRLFE